MTPNPRPFTTLHDAASVVAMELLLLADPYTALDLMHDHCHGFAPDGPSPEEFTLLAAYSEVSKAWCRTHCTIHHAATPPERTAP